MSRGRTAPRPAVLAVANSEYARLRASQLFDARTPVAGPFSNLWDAGRALCALARARPRVVYLIDVGLDTAVCAPVARAIGARVVVDTGDLAYALARSSGSRSRLGLGVVWAGERLMLALAHHVVVRGTEHRRFLRTRHVTHAPDLAPASARPVDAGAIRAELGLDGAYVVGLIGSLTKAPRLGTVYGWEIVEALPDTPSHVMALFVGDGDGIPWLRQRAKALGVVDRCRFAGRVPFEEVSAWVSAMDVGISTQTNDPVGSVRTTGKLPLYLTCGVPVLASNVGEAHRLLGSLGWTLRYDGVVDRGYPRRLAEAITALAGESDGPDRRAQALELAARAFDPDEVRARVAGVIAQEVKHAGARG